MQLLFGLLQNLYHAENENIKCYNIGFRKWSSQWWWTEHKKQKTQKVMHQNSQMTNGQGSKLMAAISLKCFHNILKSRQFLFGRIASWLSNHCIGLFDSAKWLIYTYVELNYENHTDQTFTGTYHSNCFKKMIFVFYAPLLPYSFLFGITGLEWLVWCIATCMFFCFCFNCGIILIVTWNYLFLAYQRMTLWIICRRAWKKEQSSAKK